MVHQVLSPSPIGAKMDSGSLELITGTMFSGKTKELMRRLDQLQYGRKKFIVFKPVTDKRSGSGRIKSEGGMTMEAREIAAEQPKDILALLEEAQIAAGRRFDVVAVDEIQFFTAESGAHWVLDHLRRIGYRVIAAGLDLDFKAEPFGCTPLIAALAQKIDKLSAVCAVCSGEAFLPQRFIDGQPAPYNSPLILVGGKEAYEPRCFRCFELPGTPKRF